MTEINNLEKLIRKRAVAKGNLTRFKNFLANLDANNPDLLELEVRLKKLDLCWQAFCDIQLEIDILDDNPNDHEQERQTFENDYFKYEAMARRLLNPQVERCNLLETLSPGPSDHRSKTRSLISNDSFSRPHCNYCSGQHFINNCEQFLNLPPDKRYSAIKTKNSCTNCLKFGHSNKNCSSSACKKCGKRHHTLLHLNDRVSDSYSSQSVNQVPINLQGTQKTIK
ncbi:hypothetical protein NQ318_018215 [Aromia moschata]|uniref:CCHC-type domain-containing protein n=1 Tax=Aromia moschata TaxID=1265417 RepID=A0AAV8ZFA6_9CUCU|nr:hypothetical protein NQ318_018215 [Aromia moschata]